MYIVFFMDSPVSLLTAKSIDLVVVHDGFLCVTEVVRIVHNGYFNYRGAF